MSISHCVITMGALPRWSVSSTGILAGIEWLIASGRDLEEVNLEGKEDGEDYTALEIARVMKHQEVEVLPERFIAKSGQTLHELRVKLGVLEAGLP